MVKNYLIFDRFDFCVVFYSRFFNNDFFLVVRNLRVLHRISSYEKEQISRSDAIASSFSNQRKTYTKRIENLKPFIRTGN